MSMTEKEASQLLRSIVSGGENGEQCSGDLVRAALAYLDHLERAYIDSKAQRDEDDHPSLIKLIALDGVAKSTRITFGGQGVRGVQRATLNLEAGHRWPATLQLTSIDESALTAQQKVTPQLGRLPQLTSEIVLASFVFRGVRA